MTTIAWDGETLAADRQVTMHNMPFTCGESKIGVVSFNKSKAIAGISASDDSLDVALKWLNSGGKSKLDFSGVTTPDVQIVLITKSGDVHVALNSAQFMKLGKQPFAIGSGQAFAFGAMYAGKTALDAIEIASILDCDTGKGVDVLTIKDIH